MRLQKWWWVVSIVCLTSLIVPRILMAKSAKSSTVSTVHVFPVELLGDIRCADPNYLQNEMRDALVAELKNAGKWQYTTQPPTIGKYGRPPKDIPEQALRSEAAYYIQTYISSMKYLPRSSDRHGVCYLNITVRVFDTMTGEAVNGVDAKGYSQHSLDEGFTKKALIREATQDAARTAGQIINNYEIPVGVIIGKQNDEWILENRLGTFEPGMHLVVIHNRRKFAILRVTRVEPGFAFAEAADVPKPPALEDRAFAIFRSSYWGVSSEDSISMADSQYYDSFP